ncbi:MAG: hypothetical protein PHY93_20135 [Bacteriovorax sp.]|nr:hypothetical protein [Bacteriovorax sp.]
MEGIQRLSRDAKDLRIKSRNKFMKSFKSGFYDKNYKSWGRDLKWIAHEKWQEVLNKGQFRELMADQNYEEIVARAMKIESTSHLLSPIEVKALSDGVKTPEGAELFAKGLYQLLYGTASMETRFGLWIESIEKLYQTGSLTWPVVTAFGFIAQPDVHAYLKPNVTEDAAINYGFDFKYQPRPNWEGYRDYLKLCEQVKLDLEDLRPRDMIDIESFLSLQGSAEGPKYEH